jgi:hypothetical protein
MAYNSSCDSHIRKRIMAKEMDYIDISSIPDLLRIAEEVRTTKKPHVLRRDNEDLAVLIPITPARHRAKRTKADYDAFLAAAGGWKGLVDTDKLIAE